MRFRPLSCRKVFKSALVLSLSMVLGHSVRAQTPRWTFDGSIHNNSLAISPDERTAIVSYSERPDVIVYDLPTKKVRGVLDHFVTPRNILFEPTGQFCYISDSSLGWVEKIDVSTLKTVGTIPAGPGAFGTAISKDGSTLYVNNEAANTVTAFDLVSGHAVAVIPGFAQPRQGVRLSPDGSVLYVTNFLGDKILLVDVNTHHISGEIGGFNKIRAISITRDGKTLFAANSGTDSIAVVDIPSRAVIRQIPVGKDPYGAALTPDERFVYSGNLADNSLSVIALPSFKVVATVTGLNEPRQAIVFTHDSSAGYVLNKDLSVSRIDLAAHRIAYTISPTAITAAAAAGVSAAQMPFGPLKQIDAGVLNVGYVDAGPADGTPVILLHGWPYDIYSFVEVTPLLAKAGYHVIVPYLRGYGATRFLSKDAMRNGQPSALGQDVIAFMDALKIKKAILAGFDWGARTGDIVAALWPERVHGLVSVSGYLIGSPASGKNPLPPPAEYQWWYQFYFATERGRAGYAKFRHDFDKLIWKLASPKWNFDDSTYDRTAASFDNPDHVDIVIHNYLWRLGLAKGEPQYDGLEEKLAKSPAITVPAITLEGDANGAPHLEPAAYRNKFAGSYEHRTLTGGIGHNLPQEAPQAFVQAIIDVDHMK